MKKKMSVLLCLCLISGVGFAKPAKKTSKRVVAKSKPIGRECCTVSAEITIGGTTAFVSATKCSGWFLSDSGQSYGNACQKASDALNNLLNNQE